MNITEKIEAIIRQETPIELGRREYGALINQTVQSVIGAIQRPQRSSAPAMMMDMIVARMDSPQVASVSLNNFVRQADLTNPRYMKEAILAGTLIATAAEGTARFLGFLVAVMALGTRVVPRSEAMTLHLAWSIRRFDGVFLTSEILSCADRLRDDYEVDKVSEADIRSYLSNLVRAGSLERAPMGYKVVETIAIVGRVRT